ncbi:MAG: hypothetical protein JXA74_13470 [Anaerolineae bacterium]|nr:hypothetical protein [Anaerolineae bacterium]
MSATYLQQMRRIPRDAWLSMVGFVLIYMYFVGVAGVLGNLYLLRMGYDARYVGLGNAREMIAYTVAGPLAGAAGRRWGCRALMMLGMGLATVGGALFALGDLVMASVRRVPACSLSRALLRCAPGADPSLSVRALPNSPILTNGGGAPPVCHPATVLQHRT